MAPDELPYIDEHAVTIEADVDDVWAALTELDAFSGAGPAAFARLVGCDDHRDLGPRPLREGSSMPGFHVALAVPRSELVLAGRHRFSTYSLTFRIEDRGPGRTRLSAESRADFPGRAGTAYRTLVIGTRGHRVGVRRLLAGIRRAAEQPGRR